MDFETHVKQTTVVLLAVMIATSGAYTGSLLGNLSIRADIADRGNTIVAPTSTGDWSSILQRMYWKQKQNQQRNNARIKNDEGDNDDSQGNSSAGSSGSRQRSNSNSKNGVCGDGIVQKHRGEECDLADGNLLENSNCNVNCLRTAICGNGTIEDTEECDEGAENGRGFCTAKCKKHGESTDEVTDRETYCGDGKLQEDRGEACDDGNRENGDGCDAHCAHELPGNDSDNRDGTTGIPMTMPNIREVENSSSATEASFSASSSSTEPHREEKPALGCLTNTGEWTRDRGACAENQESLMGGQVIEMKKNVIILAKPMKPEESEEVLKQKIDVRLLGVNRTDVMRQELLRSIQEAKNRLRGLSGDSSLSGEVRDYIARGNEWLEKGETYFEDPSRSTEEVAMMVDPIKEVLQTVSELIEQDRMATVITAPQIDPILARTETLLMKFRQSFIGLIQAGIAVDDAAVDSYIAAANIFIDVKAKCLSDRTQCVRLSEVLEKLQVAQEPLKAALDEHPDILRKVESHF